MASIDGTDIEIVFVTRFNLKLPFKEQSRPVHLDRDWLTSRIKLLADYCSPKIVNQTDTGFRWIVLVDSETPPDVMKAIADVSGAEIIAAPSLASARDALSNAVSGLRELILTVRVDSDDQISCYFTERIRREAAIVAELGEETMALYFANGMIYDAVNSQFYRYQYPLNAFLGLLERVRPGGTIETVLTRSHVLMPSKFRTQIVPNDEPMWCTVVHGGNVKNKVKGDAVEPPKADW